MPTVVIPIRPRSFKEGTRLLRRAEKAGDAVELWLDRLHPRTPETVVALTRLAQKPLIVNLKDASEKGIFRGTTAERLAILDVAAAAGASYIDLPLALGVAQIRRFRQRHEHTRVIVSWHDFVATPRVSQLRAVARRAMTAGADIIKIIPTARTQTDAQTTMQCQLALAADGVSAAVFAMGEAGRVTRVLAPFLGGCLHFAALDRESCTAPGQFTAPELKRRWRQLSDL